MRKSAWKIGIALCIVVGSNGCFFDPPAAQAPEPQSDSGNSQLADSASGDKDTAPAKDAAPAADTANGSDALGYSDLGGAVKDAGPADNGAIDAGSAQDAAAEKDVAAQPDNGVISSDGGGKSDGGSPPDNGAIDAGPAPDVAVKMDCTANKECKAEEYCAMADSQKCLGTGSCKIKPQMCTEIYAPVCGCDGKDYPNACSANGAGVNVAKNGTCAPPPGNNTWYYTCGAPVCKGWTPQDAIPLCVDQKEGGTCTGAGAQCDPKDGCQRYLTCTDKDPTNGGMCPKSRKDLKSEIKYLDDAQTKKLSAELLQTKLATYRYTAAGPKAPRHLGFIIDDQPDSPAVDAQRDMVDLYGYLSMSVATIQQQQKQIDALRLEIDALKHARAHKARK